MVDPNSKNDRKLQELMKVRNPSQNLSQKAEMDSGNNLLNAAQHSIYLFYFFKEI